MKDVILENAEEDDLTPESPDFKLSHKGGHTKT